MQQWLAKKTKLQSYREHGPPKAHLRVYLMQTNPGECALKWVESGTDSRKTPTGCVTVGVS